VLFPPYEHRGAAVRAAAAVPFEDASLAAPQAGAWRRQKPTHIRPKRASAGKPPTDLAASWRRAGNSYSGSKDRIGSHRSKPIAQVKRFSTLTRHHRQAIPNESRRMMMARQQIGAAIAVILIGAAGVIGAGLWSELSDAQIREAIIRRSIAVYQASGDPCPCPY